MKRLSAWVVCLAVAVCGYSFELFAQASTESQPFFPTWKLLSLQEKQQFIAGYLRCWKDTAAILDIAIEYSRTDPDRARDALQSLRGLYGISDVRPDGLVSGVDLFYSDPKNQQATLTRAITAAMNKLR